MAPHSDPAALKNLFISILEERQITTSEADRSFYGKDLCREFSANPSLILFPESHAQVLEVVRLCNRERLSLVPSGGRTGYSGGATASSKEVVLSLERMNKILAINPVDRTAVCQAGAITEVLAAKAAEAGMFFPVDFASRGSSQIGGNIATNAGGIRVIRYGNIRDWVLGLRVVTGKGEELDLNGALFKNQSGLDLKSIFIGSEGILGVITEATLKLAPPPGPRAACLAACCDLAAALAMLQNIRAAGFTLNVFEYFERACLELVCRFKKLPDPFQSSHEMYLLIEIESVSSEQLESFLESQLQAGAITDAVISAAETQIRNFFSYREQISEAAHQLCTVHKNDLSVPIPETGRFLAELKDLLRNSEPEFGLLLFGHLGDGNIHVNIAKPETLNVQEFFERCKRLDSKVFALVQKHRGSISAEHGVGILKKEFLHFTRTTEEVALMRSIKTAFDPNGIMNPGKVL